MNNEHLRVVILAAILALIVSCSLAIEGELGEPAEHPTPSTNCP